MSEKVTVKVERNILHLPAIALRGLVVFPNNLLHFEVGRDKSIAAVEWAVRNKSEVFLIAQKDMKAEDPKAEEMYQYGVVAEIKQVMRVSDDLVRILVEGKFRAKRTELDTDGSFLLASVRPAPVRPIKAEEETEAEALLRNVKTSFDAVLSMNPRISKDVVFAVTSNNDPAFLCEYIPANLLFRFEDKQAVMEESTLIGRLRLLVERLHRERRMLEIDKEIAQKVDEAMDKNQRDYYLHEQMHMISQELGEDDDTTAEAEEYRRRIQELHLDEEREKKLLKEVDRLAKMQSSNQEGTVIRTYLDTCLDLPWNSFTEDDLDIAKAQRILDRDHYGLKKVKDRILEVLAVRKLAPDVKGQIICLVGPPGVGKTSIARSIAESLNRKYVRISLGGVRDEAEIRGHRRTYIGAMPGKIINAMISAKSSNPLMLLDEIDKLAGDFRGDPAAALLEAVDARDLPGMADVDASLLVFCRHIKPHATVALSGECADEIFGGYPWYRDPTVRERYGFPWAQSTAYRASFIKPGVLGGIDPAAFVDERYRATLAQTSVRPGLPAAEQRMRQMMNLNFKWFMQTLLDRKDRMSMYSGLEVRVPFCDYRIAEYLYSVPWEFKDYHGQEKGLLREAMRGVLPDEVLWRRKSPYPKTWNPSYLAAVSAELRTVLNDPAAPLLRIIRADALETLLASGADNPIPWYGQLMTTPQTIAWFLQLNYWLAKYKVELV